MACGVRLSEIRPTSELEKTVTARYAETCSADEAHDGDHVFAALDDGPTELHLTRASHLIVHRI